MGSWIRPLLCFHELTHKFLQPWVGISLPFHGCLFDPAKKMLIQQDCKFSGLHWYIGVSSLQILDQISPKFSKHNHSFSDIHRSKVRFLITLTEQLPLHTLQGHFNWKNHLTIHHQSNDCLTLLLVECLRLFHRVFSSAHKKKAYFFLSAAFLLPVLCFKLLGVYFDTLYENRCLASCFLTTLGFLVRNWINSAHDGVLIWIHFLMLKCL